MFVLGIETSCDETGIALVEASSPYNIVKEVVHSQVELHRLYGGVVPELASREHLTNLPLLLNSVLDGVAPSDIKAVAVTVGPGLQGCLLMGSAFARAYALGINRPLIGINHIEGHILSPFLNNQDLDFPYIALVVSGAHTEIVEVQAVGKYLVHGRTLDDAAGEAFDKAAHLLGFEYPGGAELANLADTITSSRFTLPSVMKGRVEFSFSGLKTAIALLVKKHGPDAELKQELCWTVQEAIVQTLVEKLRTVVREVGCKRIAVVGGVAANKRLRTILSSESKWQVVFPAQRHCVDNGAMIAYVGARRLQEGKASFSQMSIKSRWPVESMGV